MPNRCKLIAPTQLMLERPMYGPVEETEFLLFGMKEVNKLMQHERLYGFALGFVAAVVFVGFVISFKSLF